MPAQPHGHVASARFSFTPALLCVRPSQGEGPQRVRTPPGYFALPEDSSSGARPQMVWTLTAERGLPLHLCISSSSTTPRPLRPYRRRHPAGVFAFLPDFSRFPDLLILCSRATVPVPSRCAGRGVSLCDVPVTLWLGVQLGDGRTQKGPQFLMCLPALRRRRAENIMTRGLSPPSFIVGHEEGSGDE